MKLKKIAENHGLTPEGVDYALTQYQIVISEITHGMMSKLSYDATKSSPEMSVIPTPGKNSLNLVPYDVSR